jgi:hypothetical protein
VNKNQRSYLRVYSDKLKLANPLTNTRFLKALYYRWRDQLLHHGPQAFETKNITKKEQRLEDENRHLKQIIGDLTIALKKSEYL